MEKQNDPVGFCGVAAVAVNHGGIQLANESALAGVNQQTVGCDPAYVEVCPCEFCFTACFAKNHKGVIKTRQDTFSYLKQCRIYTFY